MNTFTISEALSYGWTRFKENWAFLVLLTLVFFALGAVTGGKDQSGLMKLLAFIVNSFAMFTFVRVSLKIRAGGKPEIRDIFDARWGTFWRYVLASLVFCALYVLGLIALVVPGIVVMIRLGFFAFPLVEESMGSWESVLRSWELTRRHFWAIFWFSLVILALNILGALLLGLGVLVTSPVSLLASVYVYDKLKALPVKVSESHLTAETKK